MQSRLEIILETVTNLLEAGFQKRYRKGQSEAGVRVRGDRETSPKLKGVADEALAGSVRIAKGKLAAAEKSGDADAIANAKRRLGSIEAMVPEKS